MIVWSYPHVFSSSIYPHVTLFLHESWLKWGYDYPFHLFVPHSILICRSVFFARNDLIFWNPLSVEEFEFQTPYCSFVPKVWTREVLSNTNLMGIYSDHVCVNIQNHFNRRIRLQIFLSSNFECFSFSQETRKSSMCG